MIAWPSRRRRLDPREAKYAQIKRCDEGIDRTNRIDLDDPVFQAVRKQRPLPTISNPARNTSISATPRTGSQSSARCPTGGWR